jgi:hypothetical protein
LFTRDDNSKQIADLLFKRKNAKLLFATKKISTAGGTSRVVMMSLEGKQLVPAGRCVIIPDWSLFFEGQVPMYTHFDHYCGHFAVIQRQMAEWKPRKMSELLQPGYTDRFSWYATWVSIIFACLGAIAIVTSVLQTYWSYQGTNAAIQSLLLQKLQMNQTSS